MQPLWAIDPLEQLPNESISATITHITGISQERIDFPNASLKEVLDFLPIPAWPTTHQQRIVIDASAIKDHETIKVKLVRQNLTILQAVALVADQINASLVIEPGKIRLIPMAEPNKQSE
jgi:hypothetical protein